MRTILTCLVIACLAPIANASGLLAPRDQTLPPLRITSHLVDVTIADQVALTKLSQTFHNDTGRRLEATYVFPLPEEAELTDFQMSFNGKMVQGRVLPADEARQIYQSIVRQAKDPGLIEFIGRRLLQMQVFPIEPGSDTTIEVRYQQICGPVSGMHGYHYPLRTSQSSGQVYGPLRFSVDLQTSAALKSIWSPSHSVEIVRDGERRARIAYEKTNGSLEDDFLLLYDTDQSDLGCSVIAHKPQSDHSGHFVLLLTPKQLWPADKEVAQDVVFVLDTSGSMAGEKLKQAKAALGYCVDQLGEADRFSVVRFSTGYDGLFDALKPATTEARGQAKQWIGQFSSSGGTNIADTMQYVMSLKPAAFDDAAPRPFVVVFLTDGQGNRGPDEIMKAIGSAKEDVAGATRIFPFGVGHDVNTMLLDRLAGDYQGKPTYVQPGENLELVLGDFFSVISRPVLTDCRLQLPGIAASERFPAALGDLYHGQQLVVAGQFMNEATGPVKLTAFRQGKPVEYIWPKVAFTNTAEATYVPSVWAGRKIAYLIDQIRRHGENEEMIGEVLALSQRYGIQTPYSSWLVDPERDPVILGQMMRGSRDLGLGGGAGRRGAQREILRSRSMDGVDFAPPPGVAPVMREGAITAASGKSAVEIAEYSVMLKERSAGDAGRLDDRYFAAQLIGGRWYNRIGEILVDQEIDTNTEITVIKFGSDAYFDLIDDREDLRAVLAKSRQAMVLAAKGQAVLIADDEGAEMLTEELRKKLGIEAD